MSVKVTVHKHPLSSVGAKEFDYELDVKSSITLEALVIKLNPAFKPGTYQPVIARIDGEEIPAIDWDITPLCNGQHLTLRPRPFGVDPISWAIMAFTAITAIYTYTQMQSMQNLNNNHKDLPEQSPTYDLNAQGNSPRLGQPIPVGYGRQRVWPDFAAMPFRRFIDGEQYLFHVFGVGQGENALSEAKIGNTLLSNFENYEQQICMPGEQVTLFSPDVYTSSDVSNIELFAPNDEKHLGWSGPHTVSPSDVQVTTIGADLIAPQGLGLQDKQTGALSLVSVTIEAEYRPVDESDIGIGAWTYLDSWTLEGKTVEAIRTTVATEVPPGRYEVRMRRSSDSAGPSNIRLQDSVFWGELKCVIESDHTYDHTVWAVKIKVDGQLSGQSERRFNVVRQRLLPVWDGTSWSQPQATRSPAWAFCDQVKADYGGEYDDSYLDLPAIKRLADVWLSRNDFFDFNIDTKSSLDAVLQMIAKAGRAEKIEYKGVYSMVRDEPKIVPDYMFGMTEHIVGSFEWQYDTMDQWENDAVEMEYRDADTGMPVQVLCVLPGKAGTNPVKLKRDGITNHAQAYREGMFEAAKNEYRNRICQFKTELAGGLPEKGSCVAVSHYSSNWGTSGEVLDLVDNGDGTQTLTLSEDAIFETGKTYVVSLADKLQQPQGPYVVTAGSKSNQIVINSTHNASIYKGFKRKRSSFMFGVADKHYRRFLMRTSRPAGAYQFSFTGEYDDPKVHEIDDLIADGTISTPPGTTINENSLSLVTGFTVRYSGTASQPIVKFGWNSVDDATSYILQISHDNGSTWQPFGTSSALAFTKNVDPVAAVVRITARNEDIIGGWATLNILPGITSLPVPPVPTGFDAVGKTVTVECVWDDATDQYLNHSHTELWRSETNDIGTAGIVKPVIHTRYTDTVDPGSSLYYWIRHVSKADVPGPFNAVAGKHVETGTDPAAILELLESRITTSQLHADLLASIELITADDTIDGSVAQRILQAVSDADGLTETEAGVLIGAAISQEVSDRNAAINSAVVSVNNATGNALAAAISQEVTDREASINQEVAAEASNRTANILVEHNARMVADGIIADSVAQLDSKVDNNYASIQQKFTTYDGIYAQWTIKTDVNGHIAGVGLMNDGVTSSFVILASNFSVLDPNDPSKVVIGTYNGLAVIEGAYIKAASVDTLQLAGQAVTIPASGKVSGTSTLNGQTYTAVSKLFSSVGKPVFISGHVIISGMAIDCTVALKRGSVTLYSYSVAAAGYDSNPNGSPSYKSAVIPCPIAEKDTPPAGDHTYSIVVTAVGVAKIKSRVITLIGVKDT